MIGSDSGSIVPASAVHGAPPQAGPGGAVEPNRSPARWHLRNWRMRWRVLALVLVPTLAALTLGALRVQAAATTLVAAVPERLARRLCDAAGVQIVEVPLGTVELVEAAWWHPLHATDPALTWLRGVVAEIAASLAPVAGLPGQRRPGNGG